VPFDDAVSIVTMLIFGGLETTTNTLGSTLLQLGRDQELQRRLRDSPELLSASVEEFLRLHAPTIDLSRYVTRPTVLEGLSIEAGQRVSLSFAAANRDPKIFESPDEFSLERPHNRHYAFGVGIHRCLGSNLARLVLRVALEVLLARLRDIEVADGFQPVYHPVGVRSLESLDLTFRIEQPAAA
jgi:cytochrome P450